MLHALRFVALVLSIAICTVSAFLPAAASSLQSARGSTRTCTTMGIGDVLSGVASGVGRGLVGAKDALYDAYDAIDDKLSSQQQQAPPTPVLPVDSRKQKVVRSGSNPLSAVAAAAASVKDTVYAGVEVVTEA